MAANSTNKLAVVNVTSFFLRKRHRLIYNVSLMRELTESLLFNSNTLTRFFFENYIPVPVVQKALTCAHCYATILERAVASILLMLSRRWPLVLQMTCFNFTWTA